VLAIAYIGLCLFTRLHCLNKQFYGAYGFGIGVATNVTIGLQAQYQFLAPWCKNTTVLVAECQQGQGVLTLAHHGAQWIDALDTDASHIQYARQHHANPAVAYHPKSPLDVQMNRTYQRVLCLNLLEHTDAPDVLVRNLHQHLAEDGVFIVSVERKTNASLDFQTLRNLLVPYFPYLYLYYLNQHLAVSIVDTADAEPKTVWLTPDRQLDVNACEAIVILAGKQRFSTQGLPSVLAVNSQADLIDLRQQNQAMQLALEAAQAQQHPLTHQLAAARQDVTTLKAELTQTRDRALTAQQRLIQQQSSIRRLQRFEHSPLMKLNHETRGVWLRLRREWRHGLPFKIEKPQLPQTLTLPWQTKRLKTQPRLLQTLSWKDVPLEQLLVNELDWLKQQSIKKHALKAGFKKVLVIGASLRWSTWQEAFELHGIAFGCLAADMVSDPPELREAALAPWLDADVVILHQLPFSDVVQGIMNTFKNRHTPVVYDADTLSCDPIALQHDNSLSLQPLLERELRQNLAERLRLTRDYADYAIAANQPLALALKTEDSPAYVVPSPLGYAQRVLTDVFKNPERYWESTAKRLWMQLPDAFTGRDTQSITAIMVKLLLRYPGLSVSVSHHQWAMPTEWFPFKDRIKAMPVLTVLEHQRQLALHDIQLLPVNTDNPVKQLAPLGYWVQLAALSGVPTVASPTASLMTVIQDGVTGYMASTPEEWLTHLTHLIEQPNVRENQAQQAREQALRMAYVDNQLLPVVSTLEQLMVHYQRYKHAELGAAFPSGQDNALNVAVAFQWHVPLGLDTLCRLRTLLDLGLYITLYVLTDQSMADVRPLLEAALGPSQGRYHCARLKDALHPHDVCIALDWHSVEAAQPVQSRFNMCIRWIDSLETDNVPMGLDMLRIEHTYRHSQWLHVTPHTWLSAQLHAQYQTPVQCLAPYCFSSNVSGTTALRAELNSQRVLVWLTGPLSDWFLTALAALKRQCPEWTWHIMGAHDPKHVPFDHTHHAPPQTVDELSAWLHSGDVLLLATTGAPEPMAFWAMAQGLPVVDLAIPGRESRYDSECPVVQLPMGAYVDQMAHILTSHHYRVQLAEQSLAYTQDNTIPLDSQLNRILSLARQQVKLVAIA
jgi:SAM-dependent methyltransferase